ncbi:hypothetical protein M0802_003336 [Mischocyttarus mexicanus]|nr:hypothetical protein M0802_003336 [Mischocyttarus mexicanus]
MTRVGSCSRHEDTPEECRAGPNSSRSSETRQLPVGSATLGTTDKDYIFNTVTARAAKAHTQHGAELRENQSTTTTTTIASSTTASCGSGRAKAEAEAAPPPLPLPSPPPPPPLPATPPGKAGGTVVSSRVRRARIGAANVPRLSLTTA